MKPLRKRHLQVWILLAVLIPAGIISAYIAVPVQATGHLFQRDTTAALPVVINKMETKNYSVYLRSSADKKNYQLQWINTRASTQPSSLIYKESNGEKELIGRIGSNGTYFFTLKADSTNRYKFILFDIIHRQTTDIIKF